MMRILYFDTWRQAPAPLPFPDCLMIQVQAACTPGEAAGSSAPASRMQFFRHIFTRRRRSIKRALRYMQAIGIPRTIFKVRSNILSAKHQVFSPLSAVAGIVRANENDSSFPVGSMVAGYRLGHPLYADYMILHPAQVAHVPSGILPQDASTLVYYAIALETFQRLKADGALSRPLEILGDSLPCRLLQKFITETGRDVRILPQPPYQAERNDRTGGCREEAMVVGSRAWYENWRKGLEARCVYFMGLNADLLSLNEWEEIRSRWVGFPPSAVHNLNILSRMPLELPDYLQQEGLSGALKEMGRHSWEPGSLLAPFLLNRKTFTKKLDLRIPCSIRGLSEDSNQNKMIFRSRLPAAGKRELRVGFIGLGMWARGNLIPFLLGDGRVRVVMGVDQDPIRLQQAADLFALPAISTDPEELCKSEVVDAIFIATWHEAHAPLASLALNAGKKVFVEKPPVLDYGQLALLASSLKRAPQPFLAVGYNRVHSDLTSILRERILAAPGPVHITAIVRQPTLEPTHYYYWPHQGSRVVGNACHWIDYAFYLLSPRFPEDLRVVSASQGNRQDEMVIIMRYADGSLVTLVFSARGESLIGGDEYLDIKIAGEQYTIQDFKRCCRYREGKTRWIWQSPADRGWKQEMREVVDGMISGKPSRDPGSIIASSMLLVEARLSWERGGEVRPLDRDRLLRLEESGVPSSSQGDEEGLPEVRVP